MPLVVLVLWAAQPVSATATPVRQVAQLPIAPRAAVVDEASDDGRWLLVETATGDEMLNRSLWSVDTVGGISRALTTDPSLVSQASDGAFAGWVSQSCGRPARVHRVAAGGGSGGTSMKLPGRYVRSAVLAMTVSSSGGVTLLVSDGRKCDERGPDAILSAAPGASRFTEVVRTTGKDVRASVSPGGRVFALCFDAGPSRGANRRSGELAVVDTEPDLVLHTARASYFKDPGIGCAASDGGTATMAVVQHVPGSRGFGPRDFRTAGVTVGEGRTSRFALRGGTGGSGITAVSPNGTRIVLDFVGHAPLAVRLDGGASHALPRSLDSVDLQSGPASPSGGEPGTSVVSWSPFVDVLAMNELADRDNRLRTLDLVTGRWGRPLHISRQGSARICFLPSGRLLVATGTFASGARTSRVSVSDANISHFARVSTRSLGTVFAITCDAASQRVYLTTTDSGRVLEADADAVDGSAFAALF